MDTGMLVPASMVGPMIARGRLAETVGRGLLDHAVHLQVGGMTGPAMLDLAAVDRQYGPDVAGGLLDYLQDARQLWAADGGGQLRDRWLVDARQVASSAGRQDLTDLYDALWTVPGVGPWVDELLADPPDQVALDRHGRPLRAAYQGAPDSTHVTATITPTSPLWPASLGGSPSPAEQERSIRVTVRRATWRTRRVRRLARVAVVATERWP